MKLRAEKRRIEKQIAAFRNYRGFVDQPWRSQIIAGLQSRVVDLEIEIKTHR